MRYLIQFLPSFQVVISLLLIAAILLQQRGGGLSSTFGGGGGGFYHTKRGIEKLIFRATILLGFLFIFGTLLKLFT